MANARPDPANLRVSKQLTSARRLPQQDLVNRTGNLGKYVVRVGADKPYRAYHDHQNYSEHHGVFSDILPFFVTTKSPQKFHTQRAAFPRMPLLTGIHLIAHSHCALQTWLPGQRTFS